ncbi:hypothetical protein [Halorubrum sp. Ea1]|uniref:hypothetical protein n=1 Tax=Halorubrum sp. Ea1 TaxID=1480718 RepID=UPI00114076CF|nr:hypothetical protein [Halorubrum sp. Ea1]
MTWVDAFDLELLGSGRPVDEVRRRKAFEDGRCDGPVKRSSETLACGRIEHGPLQEGFGGGAKEGGRVGE